MNLKNPGIPAFRPYKIKVKHRKKDGKNYKDVESTQYVIVLRNEYNEIVRITDLHKYVVGSGERGARSIYSNGGTRFKFVTQFLNYVFFQQPERSYIKSVLDISSDDVKNWFNYYASSNTEELRSKATVDQCANSILDFLTELKRVYGKKAAFNMSDFTTNKVTQNQQYGSTEVKPVLALDLRCNSDPPPPLRDIPNKIFYIMADYAKQHQPDIYFLIILQAFGGLRPSEACNVSRRNLSFIYSGERVHSVDIDIRDKLPMRADGKDLDGLKRKRIAHIYPTFIPLFMKAYDDNLEYLKTRNLDSNYLPFSVDKKGNALTYNQYYYRFKKMLDGLSRFLKNHKDPEVSRFAEVVNTRKYAMHSLRHWFTVTVLCTYDGPDNGAIAVLQYWRGDRSPKSALPYIQNKTEIIRAFGHVENQYFNDLTQLCDGEISEYY